MQKKTKGWAIVGGILGITGGLLIIGLVRSGFGNPTTPRWAAPDPSVSFTPVSPSYTPYYPNFSSTWTPHYSASSSAAAPSSEWRPLVAPGPTEWASGTYEVVASDELPDAAKIPAGPLGKVQLRTSGPTSSHGTDSCYWERASNDSGETSSIIANDNISGPGSVTVKKGEFLKLSGTCVWKQG